MIARAVEGAKEKRAEIAAFFDLDGTLIPGPSLERRFFRELRCRQMIGWGNYLRWSVQALRLAPRGITELLQGNKMYLRGVALAATKNIPSEKRSCTFFAAAVERVAWHAQRGDSLVIVSGTLEFLARGVARELETILLRRGISTKVHVCATRLEENDGRWTGRIAGEAMFGGAKLRAVRRLAAQMGVDLQKSYAYGNGAQDRWLLDEVENPWAVNPAPGLSRAAHEKNWPIVWWNAKIELTQKTQRAQRVQRRAEEITRPRSAA